MQPGFLINNSLNKQAPVPFDVWSFIRQFLIEHNLPVLPFQDYTPLQYAIHVKCEPLALELIKKGANINLAGTRNCPPIVSAIIQGMDGLVKLLIERKATLDLHYDGLTPLQWAAIGNQESICLQLLQAGVPINTKDIGPLSSVLFSDIRNTLSKNILETGARLTAFNIACLKGYPKIAQLLIDHGTTLEVPSYIQSRYLITLVKSKSAEAKEFVQKNSTLYFEELFHIDHFPTYEWLLECLHEKGVDFDQIVKKGENFTLLTQAVSANSIEKVRLLKKLGVNFNKADASRRIPVIISCNKANEVMLEIFAESQVDLMVHNQLITPLSTLKMHYKMISPSLMLRFEKLDGTFTTHVTAIHLLSHRFSLENCDSRGLTADYTLPYFLKSMQEFSLSHKEKPFHFALEAFESSSVNCTDVYYLQQRIESGKPVILQGGAKNRPALFVFCKIGNEYWLIKCKREGVENNSAISYFSIGSKENLIIALKKVVKPERTWEWLDNLALKDYTQLKKIYFFEEGINHLLGLKQKHFVAWAKSKVNNTGWAIWKMGLFTLMSLYNMQQGATVDDSLPEFTLYRDFTLFDRSLGFNMVKSIPEEMTSKMQLNFEHLAVSLAFRLLKPKKEGLLENVLIAYPKIVNKYNQKGMSLLYKACLIGGIATVTTIIKYKGDSGLKSSEGLTCMHGAAINGNTNICRLLCSLNKGLLEAVTNFGYTPLHVAALNGHEETVAELLGMGANRGAKTVDGEDAVVLARKNNHLNVVRLLNAPASMA